MICDDCLSDPHFLDALKVALCELEYCRCNMLTVASIPIQAKVLTQNAISVYNNDVQFHNKIQYQYQHILRKISNKGK